MEDGGMEEGRTEDGGTEDGGTEEGIRRQLTQAVLRVCISRLRSHFSHLTFHQNKEPCNTSYKALYNKYGTYLLSRLV